jgi:hypothetical protein
MCNEEVGMMAALSSSFLPLVSVVSVDFLLGSVSGGIPVGIIT